MSYLIKLIFLSIFLLCASKASTFEALDVSQKVYSHNSKKQYLLSAKKYFLDTKNLKKYNYLNRIKIAQNYKYFENGTFKINDIEIMFKKSYRIGNKIFFRNSLFYLNNLKHVSKECTVNLSKLTLTCKHTKFYENQKLKHTKLFFSRKLN